MDLEVLVGHFLGFCSSSPCSFYRLKTTSFLPFLATLPFYLLKNTVTWYDTRTGLIKKKKQAKHLFKRSSENLSSFG